MGDQSYEMFIAPQTSTDDEINNYILWILDVFNALECENPSVKVEALGKSGVIKIKINNSVEPETEPPYTRTKIRDNFTHNGAGNFMIRSEFDDGWFLY